MKNQKQIKSQSENRGRDFLSGGGELGRLIRAKDWNKTPLGPFENWPQSLKTATSIVLRSPMPMVMLWGQVGTMIYNDAYAVFAGERHPFLLGSDVLEGWPEVSDFNQNVMDEGLQGNTLSYHDQELVLYRNNIPEEVAMDLNYSPIIGESGEPAGILAIVVETTKRVIAERQLILLRELAIQSSQAKTYGEACSLCLKALQKNSKDIPFAGFYQADQDNKLLTLTETIGIEKKNILASMSMSPEDRTFRPVLKAIEAKEVFLISDLRHYFHDLPQGSTAKSPHQAAIVPVMASGHPHLYGILIVGLNPVRIYDEDYQLFLKLISGQIGSAIAHAQAYEETKKRFEALAEIDRVKKESETRLYSLFMQVPALIAVLRGPQHIFELGNPLYMKLIGKEREIIGKPVIEALPEVKDQGFIQLLDNVYKTGNTYTGNEMLVRLDRHGDGKLDNTYINFTYQPFKDTDGSISGVFVHGVDVTDLVLGRKKIAESEAKYRSLFETMDQGFCIVEMLFRDNEPVDYKFLEINPVFEKQTGLHNASGKTAMELVPNLEKRWLEIYGEVAITGQSIRFVEESLAMGRSFEVYAFRHGDNNSRKVALLFTDITDRKLAEEAFRKSELRFKTYLEAMPQMAFIADVEGNIFYYNRRWYDYIGVVEGTEGWGWKSKPIHHPDDLQKTIDSWSESIKTGNLYEIEYRLRRHDGEYRWHLGRAVPFLDNTGKTEMWLGTNTDIHEQKEAEEALRKSEEFNRTLIEGSPDCVKALDLEGRIISINTQGQKMLEIDEFSAVQNVKWTSLWNGNFHKKAIEVYQIARHGGIGRFQGFRPTTKGTPKWWDVIIAPVHDARGEVERLICVSRDITQQKELENQKEEFIGIASHELKTPVTSIKGSLQIIARLMEEKSYELAGNFLEKANLNVDKLTGLINDLLDVSKIQAGRLQYNFSTFEAKDIIENCVEQVSHQVRNHKITIRGDTSTVIYGDKVRLEQVVNNLLTNAIKYSPGANEVILEVAREKSAVKIAVTDYGVGISEENLGKVFDRFFRVEKNAHQFQGLGLGLYICSEIVKRHSGNLIVESQPGKGSTFYFTLPSKQTVKNL